jgi:hypothetical protein
MGQKIDVESLGIVLETVEAVKRERKNRGNWADEEISSQGEEGILSVSEGLECFLTPYTYKKYFERAGLGKELENVMLDQRTLDDDFKRLLGKVKSEGFLPTPYFRKNDLHPDKKESGLVPFTDTVSYVLTTTLDYAEVMQIKGKKISNEVEADIKEILERGVEWLLNNMQDVGGYSWGSKEYGRTHVYFTYTGVVGLQGYKNNTIYPVDEQIEARIANCFKKCREWLEQHNEEGIWFEFGNEEKNEGGKEPLYTAYAAYALNLLDGDANLIEKAVTNLLQELESDKDQFKKAVKHSIPKDPWVRDLDYEDHTTPAITLQLLLDYYLKTDNATLIRDLSGGISTLYNILIAKDLRDIDKKYWRVWGYRTYFNQVAIEALTWYGINVLARAETYPITPEQLYSAIKDVFESEEFIRVFSNTFMESLRFKLGMSPPIERVKEVLEEIKEEE